MNGEKQGDGDGVFVLESERERETETKRETDPCNLQLYEGRAFGWAGRWRPHECGLANKERTAGVEAVVFMIPSWHVNSSLPYILIFPTP